MLSAMSRNKFQKISHIIVVCSDDFSTYILEMGLVDNMFLIIDFVYYSS